jgi:hypothetical protein
MAVLEVGNGSAGRCLIVADAAISRVCHAMQIKLDAA